MGFCAFFNCYTLRVNLSVAIVTMANASYLRELETADITDGNMTGTGTSDDVCGDVDDSDYNDKLNNLTDQVQVVLSVVCSLVSGGR